MNPWTRNGFFYTCTKQYANKGHILYHTKKLDIVSYYLIKWIHGEAKLIEIANN